MAEYNFTEIEKKWQDKWEQEKIFKAELNTKKPKYYTLDMFPYPSGAGLHVGHPLGYIATDIVARYKRIKGFNVLHPMGFDSFGLPAEQYAVQTGQHPALTTEQNITRYKEQLRNMGFSFDWDKEVRTSDPSYYKWTQWIFIQLFKSWYNNETNKAESIDELIKKFIESGNKNINAACDEDTPEFTAEEWKKMDVKQQSEMLEKYRLTFLADTMVNWCPELGTVLANEEVKDGVSERGGYPVVRKTMSQWNMRITAYAERLLQGLDTIDWPEPMKEMQRNWIGKSLGAELTFKVVDSDIELKVFTTRVDTTFGVTYLSIAPEHELIPKLTTPEYKKEVEKYVETAKNRSERDRMSDVKTISGQFTGSYVVNPFNNEKIPLWIADYVLAGYGTGVVMAVPSSDVRDYAFAKHYKLPIIQVQEGEHTDISKDDFDPKAGKMINSGFLNGLEVKDAIKKAIEFIEEKKLGKGKINYKIRDSIFSRQRYWGEPIPVYYKDGVPHVFDEKDLPLVLPEIDEYKPTEAGDPPLGRAKNFKTKEGYPIELNTMPGWAGSSWYYLRYMDPKNDKRLVSEEAEKYWGQVDLYIGGSEHATGHLLYSRFWNKFLFDIGYVHNEEPFKKLINQGMIQGVSAFIDILDSSGITRRTQGSYNGPKLILPTFFVSNKIDINNKEFQTKILEIVKKENSDIVFCDKDDPNPNEVKISIDRPSLININRLPIEFVESDNSLNTEEYLKWRKQWDKREKGFRFITENDGKFYCRREVEKMSKSKFNVINPDDVVTKYGADTLRMYEMFLGPLEQFKPWNTNGIEGVHKFLRRLWRLFYDESGKLILKDAEPSKEELKTLHKTIKKIEDDIERYSFNTSVSNFMICVNELTALRSSNRKILQDLIIILSPYAPHISEELWSILGNKESISKANFPKYDEQYLTESNFEYPVSFNGKMRMKINLSLSLSAQEIEKEVLASEEVKKYLEGKEPKKIIVVPGKIVNLVI
jgi:leucyl-tRNA synthetase